MAAMGPQIYTRRDVRRLLVALGFFVVVPCGLLLFLGWQSLQSLHAAAVAQRREAIRHELQDAGREFLARWEELLIRAGEPVRGRDPATAGFWSAAQQVLGETAGIRAILALDAAGRLAFPQSGQTGGGDLPRLSGVHPAAAALDAARRAHWIENDPDRAVEFYRAVLAEPRTPEAVRVAVCAEMAQCHRRRGERMTAGEDYDRMLAEARTEVPSVWAVLGAVELARESGDAERTARWTRTLLEVCLRDGLAWDLDTLQAVRERLPPTGTEDAGAAGSMRAVDQLIATRQAAEDFVQAHGKGPFSFARDARRPGFAVVPLAPAQAACLGVDAREALAGGVWLAFEIDLDAWREAVAAPLLRGLAERWGGQAEWMATPAPGAPSQGPDLVAVLPEPLNQWSLGYREKPVSRWAVLAGTPSKSRVAILGLAVVLALAGLMVPFFYLRRSLRLAGLQADVMDRISHELRTPITSLAVLADSLERHADGTDAAAGRRLRALVREEVQRLARLSARLLDFARQRAGPVRLRCEPAQLNGWVAEIAQRLPAETGLEPGNLALALEPGNYAGAFDREALEEILRNLVENAVKYSAGPAEVRIGLRRAGAEARLTVSDRGLGMEARTVRRLFTPYFRGDAGLSARVPGLGLGLAIVQGLVRAHGGAITVQSAPGQGSTFELRLPLAPDSSGEEA